MSGRGEAGVGHPVSPELAAPGVNIITARAGGGYEAVTGTSFAAPFVTGSAALMMQWGIVNGNDPYLYGEKLKAGDKVYLGKACMRFYGVMNAKYKYGRRGDLNYRQVNKYSIVTSVESLPRMPWVLS